MIQAVADRPAMGPDQTPAASPAKACARRPTSGRQATSAGGHPVDPAQRSPLAGSAGTVSASVDLLAAAARLGAAECLVADLADVLGGS